MRESKREMSEADYLAGFWALSAIYYMSRRRELDKEFADDVGPVVAVIYVVVSIFLGSIFVYLAAVSFKESILLSILFGVLALILIGIYGSLAYLCWFRRYDFVKPD